jgi:hypothetical protein
MDLSTIGSAVTAIIVFIGPFVALAIAAARYGVDSRPTGREGDQRPWLVATA